MSAYWLILILVLGGVFSYLFYRFCQPRVHWPSWMEWGLSLSFGLGLSGFLILLMITGLEGAFPDAFHYANAFNNCDPSYPEVCISPGPPDLDCDDITFSDFKVVWPDTHRFDADGNGIGCER